MTRNVLVLNKRKTIVFITTFILSVVTALRIFGYDRDYLNYQKFYDLTAFGYHSRFESGFEFFTNTIKFILGSESFVLFLFQKCA